MLSAKYQPNRFSAQLKNMGGFYGKITGNQLPVHFFCNGGKLETSEG